MTEDQRRHKRTVLREPVSLTRGEERYEGTLNDISDGGASVEFDFRLGKSAVHFDIGSNLEVASENLDNRKGRVIRHYKKGFAVKFD